MDNTPKMALMKLQGILKEEMQLLKRNFRGWEVRRGADG